MLSGKDKDFNWFEGLKTYLDKPRGYMIVHPLSHQFEEDSPKWHQLNIPCRHKKEEEF